MEDLKRRLSALEQSVALRPYRHRISDGLYMLQIIDGQTVYNSGGTIYYGIKLGSPLSGVATAYDPNVSTTPGTFAAADDGVGRAFLYINGAQQSVPVLVALDGTGPIPNVLLNGDFVMTQAAQARLVVGAGPTSVMAYTPIFQ